MMNELQINDGNIKNVSKCKRMKNDRYNASCSKKISTVAAATEMWMQHYYLFKGMVCQQYRSLNNKNNSTIYNSSNVSFTIARSSILFIKVIVAFHVGVLATPSARMMHVGVWGITTTSSNSFSQIFRAGPKPCSGGEGKGYSNLDDLRNDVNKKNTDSPKKGGTFILCPDTIFDFSSSTSSSKSLSRSGLPNTQQLLLPLLTHQQQQQQQQQQAEDEEDYDLYNFNADSTTNTHYTNPSAVIAEEFGYVDTDEQPYNENEYNDRRRTTQQSLQNFPWDEVQDLDSFLTTTTTTTEDNQDENDEFTDELLSTLSGRAIDLNSFNKNNNSSGMQITATYSTTDATTIPTSASDPLVITASNTIIQCGQDGSIENNCQFVGGLSQIVIGDNASSVVLQGITFTNAGDVAVISSGSTESSVTILQCKFEKNFGDSCVMIVTFPQPAPPSTPSPTSLLATNSPTTLPPVATNPPLPPMTLPPNTTAPLSVTAIPTSLAPVSVTVIPTTLPPTLVPVSGTGPPLTLAPTSLAPVNGTQSPTTLGLPMTLAPGTLAPTTFSGTNRCNFQCLLDADCSGASDGCIFCSNGVCATLLNTSAPATLLNTSAPASLPPGTVTPITIAPGTVAPITIAPGTVAPITIAPGTVAPMTIAPGTVAPMTIAPGTPVGRLNNIQTKNSGGESKINVIETALPTLSLQDIFPDDRRELQVNPPPFEPSSTVFIQECNFTDNANQLAVVGNFQGKLFIERCRFSNNEVGGSAIYVSSNGDLTINSTCIENNKIRTFPGVIFLEQKSNLINANSNFGDNNTGKNFACNGVFQDTPTGRGLCSEFDASSCPLNPPPNVTCFTDWRDLSEAIAQSIDGGIFVICENTILDVSLYPEQQISPIVIDKDNIIIMCGDSGVLNNNCTVFDGDFQFRIESGTGIQFLGVTFTQAGKISITIEQTTRAVKDVEVAIVESSFKENVGDSVIDITAFSKKSLKVKFLNETSFSKNNVKNSVIQQRSGTMSVFDTIFEENTSGNKNAIILVDNEGELNIERSCFRGNKAIGAQGTIVVTGGSTLNIDRNNFGFGNDVGSGSCSALYLADSNTCENYTATECLAGIKVPPTATPSGVPTPAGSTLAPTTSIPTPSPSTQTPKPSPKPTRKTTKPAPKPLKPTKRPIMTSKPTFASFSFSFSYSYSYSYSMSYPPRPSSHTSPVSPSCPDPDSSCPKCPICPECSPCPKCPKSPPCPKCPDCEPCPKCSDCPKCPPHPKSKKDKSKKDKKSKKSKKGKKDKDDDKGKKGPKFRRERRRLFFAVI